MKRKSILLLAFLLMLYIVPTNLMLSSYSSGIVAQPNNPQFVLSSWEYPDEYGQGIYQFEVYENSTGAWVEIGNDYFPDDPMIFRSPIGASIKLKCWTYFNNTIIGAVDVADGKNYLQHNVTVTDNIDATVFSQQNFTYEYGSLLYDPMWRYCYSVVLNFIAELGEYYTVTVTYDLFAPSTEYGISDESIASFGETLSDDVLFYPDPIVLHNSTVILASSGDAGPDTATNAYTDTHTVNAVAYYGTKDPVGTAYVILNFTHSYLGNFAGFGYSVYCKGLVNDDSAALWFYNWVTDAWVEISSVTMGTYDWENGTTDNPDYWNDTQVSIKVTSTDSDGSAVAYIDYAEITQYYYLASEEGYVESFADVSDWAIQTGNTITTDGDVGSFHVDGDNAWDYYYSNGPSITNVLGYYVEYRFSANSTTGGLMRVYGFTEDTHGGTSYTLDGGVNLFPTTTWQTKKLYIDYDGACESVRVHLRHSSDVEVMFDSFRISPANETGYQHDFSTTTGISSADGGTIASDGDLVTLTADGDGSTFLIVADTTATAAAISTIYYPFFGIDIDSGSGSWTLEQYDGAAYATLQSSVAISAGTKRFNMQALDTYVSWWRITLTASGVLVGDWAKAYSIADYTYTGTGVSLDDVLYVSDGILYCSGTSFTSITLDHDPALSFETGIGSIWELNTSSGVPQTDYYVSAWAGYSSETSGALATGTLTDFRIMFTASANIEAITFLYILPQWYTVATSQLWFETPRWEVVGTAELIFSVPIDETALNWFLILLGMFMVPASTLYLVKGGKDNMSMNKVFYFIVAFLFGWGLIFIGVS